MGRTCGKNGEGKLAENRCPESGGGREARKNENVMGGLR